MKKTIHLQEVSWAEPLEYKGTDLSVYSAVSSDPAFLQDFHDWYLSSGASPDSFMSLSDGHVKKTVSTFEEHQKDLAFTLTEAELPAVEQSAPIGEPGEEAAQHHELEVVGETIVPITSQLPQPQPDEPTPEIAQADFYVSANGSDSGTGTYGDPFATIEKAISVAGPGDLILVREGTYEGPVNIWNGGEPGAELQIKAYPGEYPVIDGATTPPDTDLVVISASHVVFEGFEVTNAKKAGIVVWSAQDVSLIDNVVHTTQGSGIWVGAEQTHISSGHLIQGNAVFNTGLAYQDKNASEGWPRAIGIDLTSDSTIVGNFVFKNYGEGIGALSSTDLEIVENYVYDNFSVQIYLDNVQDVLATDNFVFHTSDAEFYRDGEPGHGIVVANEFTDYQLASTGIMIYGNTYAGVSTAFYDGSYGWGGGVTDLIIGDNPFMVSLDQISADWLWA